MADLFESADQREGRICSACADYSVRKGFTNETGPMGYCKAWCVWRRPDNAGCPTWRETA